MGIGVGRRSQASIQVLGLMPFSLWSVFGQSVVSLGLSYSSVSFRPLSGHYQVIIRSLSGHYQVNPVIIRSLSGHYYIRSVLDLYSVSLRSVFGQSLVSRW